MPYTVAVFLSTFVVWKISPQRQTITVTDTVACLRLRLLHEIKVPFTDASTTVFYCVQKCRIKEWQRLHLPIDGDSFFQRSENTRVFILHFVKIDWTVRGRVAIAGVLNEIGVSETSGVDTGSRSMLRR